MLQPSRTLRADLLPHVLNVSPALAQDHDPLLLQFSPDLLHRQARSIYDCSLLPFSAF